MPSYNDFKASVMGKAFDIDGYYGAQCWDGYAKYCRYLGYPICHCTVTGYVQDIWTQRKVNGILNRFNEVTVMQPGDVAVFKPCNATPLSHIAIFDHDAGGGYGWFLGQNQGRFNEVTVMQPGDVAVFKPCNATPLSHIAIFDHDAGGGYGWFLGQNQGGYNGSFNVVKLPYSATYDTAFRPKVFAGAVQKPASNSGKKWTQDCVIHKGDKVKSISCAITGVQGNCVNVPALGGLVPKPASNSGKKWTQDCVIHKGDKVKSISCAITGVQGNCVNVPALGGLVPLAHVNEAADTRDGSVIHKGDKVKSISCAITGVQGNCVNVPALGGLVPLAHVNEAADTRDGRCDNYLATTGARVYLAETTAEAVDTSKNLVKVHGYWVKAGPLMGLR